MARADTTAPEGGRLASPALRAAIARSGAQLAGIACALIGLALLVALLSHDPADPSGSTATARVAHNLAGPTGAAVSDTLLQGFGFAAFLPAVALLGWAWRLFTERGVSMLPARLLALLLGLPVLAAGFSALPLPAGAPVLAGPGGAFGPLLAQAATGWLHTALGPLGSLVAHVILGLASALVLLGALGFAPAEWRRAASATAGATASGGPRGVPPAGTWPGGRWACSAAASCGCSAGAAAAACRRRPISPPCCAPPMPLPMPAPGAPAASRRPSRASQPASPPSKPAARPQQAPRWNSPPASSPPRRSSC